MAELTGRPVPSPDAASSAAAAHDPRAVRVRLAPGSRLDAGPPLRIAPMAEPLRMTNPTIGTGPLGGAALPAVDAAPGVLAQRRVLVDDLPTTTTLTGVGGERHVLQEESGRTNVVLGPVRSNGAGAVVREVLVDGFRYEVELEAERIAALRERARRGGSSSAHSGPLEVRAIIPGKIVSVSVTPGDTVTAGQQLLAVEAMKMQNELRAPRDGTIERVGVAPGVNIEVGDLLVVIS